MKSVFIFILFICCALTNAQDKIETQILLAVDSLQTQEVKIISCSGSIYNNNPLYIIDGIPFSSKTNRDFLEFLSPSDISSISVLKGAGAETLYGSAGKNGVIIIYTNKYPKSTVSRKKYSFKVYSIRNMSWTTSQDMFNDISAKVPGLTITNSPSLPTPTIRMRGDDNTIVIVDGIRYDASILNTLNPSDIESVKVSNSPVAQNYFINN